MRRREVLVLLGSVALTCARAALAQRKNWRLGWLDPNPPPAPDRPYENLESFKGALAELGYVEGRDYGIKVNLPTPKTAGCQPWQELVARGIDIIVTIGTPSVVAAKNATTTIPIVMAGSADPVEHGLVESLRRPGGKHYRRHS